MAAAGAVDVVMHALRGTTSLERLEDEFRRVYTTFEGGVNPVREAVLVNTVYSPRLWNLPVDEFGLLAAVQTYMRWRVDVRCFHPDIVKVMVEDVGEALLLVIADFPVPDVVAEQVAPLSPLE